MYIGEINTFILGLALGFVISMVYLVSTRDNPPKRPHQRKDPTYGLPTLAEAKLEFLKARSFTMLTRLQGIIGITDIMQSTKKNDINPNDIKIISEGARQIHSLLTEALNLHSNEEELKTDLAAQKSQTTNRRVLLVEDDEMMRLTCCEMLKTLGLEFDVAENGEACLAKIKTQDYGLIIMDCEMPTMDGYQATLAIRGMDGKKKDHNILGFTANALRGAEEKCLAVGMDLYLSKPVHLNELKAAITKFIPIAS